jgi:hypothetical protein
MSNTTKKRPRKAEPAEAAAAPLVFVVVAAKLHQNPQLFVTQIGMQNHVFVTNTLERARQASDALIAVGWDTAEIFETTMTVDDAERLVVKGPDPPNWNVKTWSQAETLRKTRRQRTLKV